MAIVEHRCLIHTDLATAFHTSQDYAVRSRWDPFTKHIQHEADDQVTVTAWHGMKMKVEYAAWHPPERAAIRMVQGPHALQRFAGTWIFTQNAPGIIEVRFRYQVKVSRTWSVLGPLILHYFSWETCRRLSELKYYLEQNLGKQKITGVV